MMYIFLSSVFITLFFTFGLIAMSGWLQLLRKSYPLRWPCYKLVWILLIVAVICFIAACLFGTQIPDCYVP